MNIKEPVPGVFMIENYISQDSCDFLIDVFSKDLHDTPMPNMFAGITGYAVLIVCAILRMVCSLVVWLLTLLWSTRGELGSALDDRMLRLCDVIY
jgi:hypothetical protein